MSEISGTPVELKATAAARPAEAAAPVPVGEYVLRGFVVLLAIFLAFVVSLDIAVHFGWMDFIC